jgi:GTP-binding protein
VEHTRVILHLVDVSRGALRPPVEAYEAIRKELESYSPALAGKPEVVVATKSDLAGAKAGTAALRARVECLEVSALKGKGLEELARRLFDALRAGDGVN